MGNNKHLVRVGHEFAAAMSDDTPIITIAKMVTALASALDVQTARSEALAAENANFRGVLTAIRDDWFIHDGDMHEWQVGGETLEQCMTRELSETPATDAFLAEVRASELDSLAGVAETMLVKFANQNASQIPEAKGWEMIQRQASHRAAQLRGNSNGGAL